MSRPDPLFHVRAEAGREFEHLVRFFVRHGPSNIVAAHVALLAKAIKGVDEFSARCRREFQRLDNAVVMIVPCGPVARSSESGGCRLECRIVGDRAPPVGGQLFHLASREIPIRNGQQVLDLVRACCVLNQPTILKPTLQAHSRYPTRKFSSLSLHYARNGSQLPALTGIQTPEKRSG